MGKNKMLSIKKTSLTHQLVLEAPLGLLPKFYSLLSLLFRQ